jgi:bidirectional [NiFe] hydrogenase diaphorase subunit
MNTSAARSSSDEDGRFKLLDVALQQQGYRQDALIEVLHLAQKSFGYLETGVLCYVAKKLKLPPSRVFGVATFYKLFTLKPKGRHTCVLCIGTACYVKGARELLAVVEQTANIHAGEVTADGAASLTTARCLGACGTAPVVVYDDAFRGQQSAKDVSQCWKDWLTHEPAATS